MFPVPSPAAAAWIFRVVVAIGPGLLAGAQSPPPAAPPAVPVPAELRALVDALASPDFKVRDEASTRLSDDAAFTLPQIESALKDDNLSHEQRYRLLAAARERFERTPRAAMGVQFAPNLRDRIFVGKTFEPFASHQLLEEGDLIVEAAGVKVSGPNAQWTIQGIIVARDPGDVLPIVVRRGPAKLNINLALGSFSDLPNSTLQDGRLIRAWRVRCAPYMRGGTDSDVISTGLTSWPGVDPARAREREVRFRQKLGQAAAPGIQGGGVPGGAPLDEPGRFQQAFINGNFVNGVVVNGRVQFFGDPDAEPQFPAMTVQEELDALAQLRAGAQSRLNQLPPNMSPDVRDGAQKALQLIDKQRQAIEAEAAENARPEPGGAAATSEASDHR